MFFGGFGGVVCVRDIQQTTKQQKKQRVEAEAGLRACIVYGALPAETRRAQARAFNDPDSDATVLVASDAVGMGLNFNIRRVVFTTLAKRTRASRHGLVPVPLALVKQIAGRAGRRGTCVVVGILC